MADQDANKLQDISAQLQDQGNPPNLAGGMFFEIHIQGHLDSTWSDWLEGLEVKLLDNGEMILYGPIVDQAALLGVLNKLGHLNLALLSVNQTKRREREENECNTNTES